MDKIKKLANTPGTAVHRLSRSLEKRAADLGKIIGAAGSSALVGGLPMALMGAFQGRSGGRGMMAHNAAIGGIVGGIPSALFGAYGEYQNQKAREQALKEYFANGGYGSEFIREPK